MIIVNYQALYHVPDAMEYFAYFISMSNRPLQDQYYCYLHFTDKKTRLRERKNFFRVLTTYIWYQICMYIYMLW